MIIYEALKFYMKQLLVQFSIDFIDINYLKTFNLSYY